MSKIITQFGTEIWINDANVSFKQLFREDGPALIHANGRQFWFHKIFPALKQNGSFFFDISAKERNARFYGLIHREDGPAIEYYNGGNHWRLNGIMMSFESWCDKLDKTTEERALLKLKYF